MAPRQPAAGHLQAVRGMERRVRISIRAASPAMMRLAASHKATPYKIGAGWSSPRVGMPVFSVGAGLARLGEGAAVLADLLGGEVAVGVGVHRHHASAAHQQHPGQW